MAESMAAPALMVHLGPASAASTWVGGGKASGNMCQEAVATQKAGLFCVNQDALCCRGRSCCPAGIGMGHGKLANIWS
jgi:hypothetical protein